MARARLDFDVLARLVCLEGDDPDCGDDYMAKRFGVQRRTVQRWHERGIDVWWADKLTNRVGLVPELVWGTTYEEAIDDECERKLGCWACSTAPCVCDAEQLTLAVSA